MHVCVYARVYTIQEDRAKQFPSNPIPGNSLVDPSSYATWEEREFAYSRDIQLTSNPAVAATAYYSAGRHCQASLWPRPAPINCTNGKSTVRSSQPKMMYCSFRAGRAEDHVWSVLLLPLTLYLLLPSSYLILRVDYNYPSASLEEPRVNARECSQRRRERAERRLLSLSASLPPREKWRDKNVGRHDAGTHGNKKSSVALSEGDRKRKGKYRTAEERYGAACSE